MLRALKILFLAVLSLYGLPLQAQTLSNKGKEFWVGYGHHQFMETNNSQEMILYFSAEEAAKVVVTINGTTYREEYNVPANTVITSKLIPKGFESVPASFFDARLYTKPPSFPGGTGSEGIFKKHAIYIESDVPIVAYSHIYGDVSSGATMLMPVETWGHSYISINTPQFYSSTYGANFNCFSWLYVVAQRNNTRVRIIPTVNTRKGDPAGVPIIVELQKGEIYQLVGAPMDQESGQNVSGTTVTSIANSAGECYPIALFSGSSRTQITCLGSGAGSGDNIMQQAVPLQAWGSRYLTSPTSVDNIPKSRNINVFRIFVRDPATVVRKNGMQLVALNTSNGYYYEYQSNTADFIEADKPILVAQYIPSANSCSYKGTGDPEMIYISPIEQSIKRVGFYRNSKENIAVNYLSLIIPTNGIASLTIDGVKGGFDDEYQHPNYPGYSVVVKRWPAAQAQCIVQSDSGFTAITYGMGGAESYGYNAGTYINNLNGYPGIKNQYSATSADNLYTCAETPVQLTVLMRYQPTILNWQLSKLAGTIAPAVDVVQNNPVPVGSQILNGMVYYRYSLQGYYRFSKPGMHAVPLLATSPIVENCNQTEEVLYVVEVKPAANTGFSIDFRNCSMSENVQFSGRDTFDNGSIIYKWNWVFDATQNAEGKSVSQVFTPGAHSVLLIAADSAGCIADSTASFVLNGKPNTPDFRVTSPDSCAGTTFIFEEMNTDASVTQWYWDFGNNDTLTVFDNKPISRRFLTPGTITVKHVVKNGQACVSDTASLVLVIHAMSTASFNMPASVCMPGGAVAFINTSTVAAGVHLNYAWQFGDGSPVSADEDPVHVYRQPGNYTVTLTAFTDKGCASEVSQVFNKFFEKPVASFSLPSYSLCQGMTARFVDESYAPGGTVNAWSWNFGDGSTSTQQEPTRQYNTPGTFQVKLVVGSSQGCVSDTFSRQLQVYPQPLVDAGPSFVVKEGANVQFQATVNAPDFVIRWSPSTGLDNPNIISPTLLNADNDEVYTVTATGQNNCSASDGLTVKVQKGVFIPNAFSPNNDGINDVWKIKNIELYPGATIEIYDRYGSVVYRSTGGSQPWNGSVKGKQAPSGTYYYIIDLKDGSSWRNGSVTLLR